MRRLTLAALIAAIAIPAAGYATRQPTLNSDAIGTMVAPCKETVERAYRLKDLSIMDRFVNDLVREPQRNRDRMIACGAYLMGVEDGARPGNVVLLPEDVD